MVEAMNIYKETKNDTHWTYKKSLEKDTQCASRERTMKR